MDNEHKIGTSTLNITRLVANHYHELQFLKNLNLSCCNKLMNKQGKARVRSNGKTMKCASYRMNGVVPFGPLHVLVLEEELIRSEKWSQSKKNRTKWKIKK